MHRRGSTIFMNGDTKQNDRNSSALASAQLIMRPTVSSNNLNDKARTFPKSRYQSNVDDFIAQFNEDTDSKSQTSRFYASENGMNRKVKKSEKASKFRKGRKSKRAKDYDSSSSISRASSTDSDAIVVIAEESETDKQKRKRKQKRRARSIENFESPIVMGTPNPMYYPKLLTPIMNYGANPAFVPNSLGQLNPYYPYSVNGYPQHEYFPNNLYGRYD